MSGFWVALTALTGKTYHLAPLIAAAAPAVVVGARWGSERPGRSAALASALGLSAVAAGWAAMTALGITPAATIVDDQPGGVSGEVAIGALLGAALGALHPVRRMLGRR